MPFADPSFALRLGVVSDIHWCPDPLRVERWHGRFDFAGVPARLRAAVARLRDHGVDAIALLGDLTQDADPASLEAVLSTVAEEWSGPLFAVPGNHDRDADVPWCSGRVVSPLPVDRLPLDSAPPDEQLVLLSHFPLVAQDYVFAARGLRYAGRLAGADDVLARLGARDCPTIVACGHVHARESRASGRILQLTFGPLVEAPFECATLEVGSKGGVTVVRRVARSVAAPWDEDGAVFCTEDETWTYANGSWTSAAASSEPVLRGAA